MWEKGLERAGTGDHALVVTIGDHLDPGVMGADVEMVERVEAPPAV